MLVNSFFFILIIVVNFFLFKKIKYINNKVNIIDNPDSRKLHHSPVPLLGGVFFLINFLFIIIYNFFNNLNLTNLNFDNVQFYSFLFGVLMFFFLGLVDDIKKNFKPEIRIIISIIILSIVCIINSNLILNEITFSFAQGRSIFEINYILGFVLTLFCFLILINAMNMSDGINILTAAFIFYLILLFIYLKIFNLNIIVFIPFFLIFLFYNNNSKIFLGSSAVMPISFILGFFFIISYKQNIIPFSDWVFVILFIPLIELLRLFVLRISKKKHPFSADQNHLHHYLYFNLGYLKSIIILLSIYIIPSFLIIFKISTLNIFFYLILYFVIIKILLKKK